VLDIAAHEIARGVEFAPLLGTDHAESAALPFHRDDVAAIDAGIARRVFLRDGGRRYHADPGRADSHDRRAGTRTHELSENA